MKNLENYGVQEMNAKEIRETDGGVFWPIVRMIVKVVAAIASYNEVCGGCVTEGINNSDRSSGGSRPFEG